nr:MAG TPA: hypothetical protein [Caudoviricetes sp.]
MSNSKQRIHKKKARHKVGAVREIIEITPVFRSLCYHLSVEITNIKKSYETNSWLFAYDGSLL